MVRLMLVLGLVLSLAACGGSRTDGLSKAEEQALQDRVDAAEAAKKKAEEDKAKADDEKAAALERERLAGLEQERQRQLAADARLAEEAAKREAERQKEAAEKAKLEALRAESSHALQGLNGTLLGAPTVGPKYRAAASVSPPAGLDPDVTFSSPRGSSAGSWYATTAHNQGSLAEDTIVVYSDVDADKSTPIGQVHTDEDTDADSNVFEITITATHADLIGARSSIFPTGGNTNPNVPTVDTDDPPDGTNDVSANIRGTFDGALGNFQCESASPCTIRHTGGGYVLGGGTWTFRISDSSTVKVADKNFMHFGWWRRKTNDGAFQYGVFSDSTMKNDEGNDVTVAEGSGFAALTGTADYVGRAIGQYAIYQPLSDASNHGEFRATARFTANFDTDMLSGTVSGFNVNSGWSLTLKETTMSGGTVTRPQVDSPNVSWTFDGNTQDGGTWGGTFHSEVSPYEGHIPDGLTGTFDAEFGDVGRLRGAYGTHYTP